MDSKLVIECQECGFRKQTTHSADEPPADVIITHGRDTGHTLSVDQPEG